MLAGWLAGWLVWEGCGAGWLAQRDEWGVGWARGKRGGGGGEWRRVRVPVMSILGGVYRGDQTEEIPAS